MKAWTVAVGNINILSRKSRAAVKYIKGLDGLIGVHPCAPRGNLILFSSENAAKLAKNKMDLKGIQTGRNICEVEILKEAGE